MVSSFDKEVIQYGTTSAGGLRPEWVAPGAVFERSFQVENKALYPVYVILNTEKARNLELNSPSRFFLMPREFKDVEVTIYAPDDTRLHAEEVMVYRYLPLLPPTVLHGLAEMHEYLPVLLVDSVVMVVLFMGYAVFGKDEVYRLRLAGTIRLRRRMKKRIMGMVG
jgi:signal peptidase